MKINRVAVKAEFEIETEEDYDLSDYRRPVSGGSRSYDVRTPSGWDHETDPQDDVESALQEWLKCSEARSEEFQADLLNKIFSLIRLLDPDNCIAQAAALDRMGYFAHNLGSRTNLDISHARAEHKIKEAAMLRKLADVAVLRKQSDDLWQLVELNKEYSKNGMANAPGDVFHAVKQYGMPGMPVNVIVSREAEQKLQEEWSDWRNPFIQKQEYSDFNKLLYPGEDPYDLKHGKFDLVKSIKFEAFCASGRQQIPEVWQEGRAFRIFFPEKTSQE